MRKYIVGTIVGAVLMFAGQAAADSISKIGKKVQAEFIVKVDGKELEARGLVIDGQTTVPARALADAVGYDVSFINKEVILERKEGGIVHDVPELEQEPPVKPGDLPTVEEPKIELTLEQVNEKIARLKMDLDKYRKFYSVPINGEPLPEMQEMWKEAEKELLSQIEYFETLKVELEAKQ